MADLDDILSELVEMNIHLRHLGDDVSELKSEIAAIAQLVSDLPDSTFKITDENYHSLKDVSDSVEEVRDAVEKLELSVTSGE